MIIINEYSNQFENLLITISKFMENKHLQKSLSTFFEDSMKVYNILPDSSGSSIYAWNKDSFEFEHMITSPEDVFNQEYFDILIDKDVIGSALNSGKPQFAKFDNSDNFCTVFPLISQEGIIGLAFIITSVDYQFLDSTFIELIRIFNSTFASSVSEIIKISNEKKNSEIFEQRIVSRTIDLLESQRELSDKINSLTSSLSMIIPHEIRTPLNEILGFIDYLRKNLDFQDFELWDEINEILNYISKSAIRLNRLLENYITYSKLLLISVNIQEIEQLPLQATHDSAGFIADNITGRAYTSERLDDVKVDLIDSSLSMNRIYLAKILDEIMDNAVKYSNPGSLIEVTSKISENNYILAVKDYGIGMTDKQINNIGPFIQFDRNSREQQGMGLGLFIVQKILSLHNGSFSIKSEKGKFTEVLISIPLFNE